MSSGAPERLLWFPTAARSRARAASGEVVSAERIVVSDEELLARVQSGDEDAVGILFDRHARLFLVIAFRILRDRGEAEDMVQEIFMHVVQQAAAFDPEKGSGRTWMVQLAYFRSFDRRKYLHRRFVFGGTEIHRLKNTLREAARLEEEIATRLTGAQLRAAFDQLNEKQAATLQLYFFEGCDFREVAERLGDSVANVRHYYYRGLERLRRTTIAVAMRNEKP